MKLTEQNSGQTIHMKVGDTFSLSLEDNSASTGYQWKVEKSDGLELIKEDFIPPSPPIIPGKPGERQFVFRVSSAGKHELIIKSMPPGLGEKPSKELRITIITE